MLNNTYPNLLSPIEVGNLVLKNRLISAPSMPHYHQGPEKYPGENIIAHFAGRARGGAALVTCSGTKIYPRTGVTSHFMQCDLFDPQVQVYLSQMADAVHFYGAKVSMILDSPKRDGYDVVADIPSHTVAGDGTVPTISKQMPASMLSEMADEYAEQCVILKQCGFDMAFVHMSYQQFFPARFLTPMLNKRTDEFGGSLENRAKFALMVFARIKQTCGKDFLIEASLTPVEPEGGLTMDEAARFIEMAKDDLDLVQVRYSHIDTFVPTGFMSDPTPWRGMARDFRALVEHTGVLVDTVGGYQDLDVCEEVIREGEADVISMARGWISNPDMGTLAYEGRASDVVPCIRCNKCHVSSYTDPYLSVCSVNPVLGYEARLDWMITPATRRRKVAVVGGGPGGMKAALVCAERGHEVTLFEKAGRLGGLLNLADDCSFKWPILKYKNWLIDQIGRQDVEVRLSVEATKDILVGEGFDEVIVAVGSLPIIPRSLPGADGANVVPAVHVYGRETTLAEDVVVIGGGEAGTETGLHLAQKKHRVTVIEMRDRLAIDSTPIHYRSLFERAWEAQEGFSYILDATCTGITGDGVQYTTADGVERSLKAGSVVIAVGMRASRQAALDLFAPCYVTHLVGDCDKVGNIQKVIRSAFGAASQV